MRFPSRFVALLLAVALSACAPIRPATELPRQASHALADPAQTRLGQAVQRVGNGRPDESAFRLLDNGMEAFLLRMAMCDVAEHTLDVQYYIYQDDKTGRLFTDALLRAADRGVRVRVLVDDLGLTRSADLIALDQHPQVEVRSYNPFTWRSNTAVRVLNGFKEGIRLNRRMHNKSFIVDNALAIIGGRNIGDEYFHASPERDFNDIDLAIAGPLVPQISVSFDDYWNSAHAYPIAFLGLRAEGGDLDMLRHDLAQHRHNVSDSEWSRALRETRLARQLYERSLRFIWAPAELVVDVPDKVVQGLDRDREHPVAAIYRHARAAEREFTIMSPYFIPGEAGSEFLVELAQRGIDVNVLTNSMQATDVAAVFAGYSPYRKPLLQGGVQVYEFKPRGGREADDQQRLFSSSLASLHSKAFVVDRRTVVITSLNLDPRSVNLNTELAVIVHSEELAERVVRRFEIASDPANSFRLALEGDLTGKRPGRGGIVWIDADSQPHYSEPGVSRWRRALVRMLSWLPIESQL
ncbi:MAG: phospholipase D family protein [Spongiibacteraceae bacterium]|nr:phospholipase D family protein [Spongiibacteraceae bacterium]